MRAIVEVRSGKLVGTKAVIEPGRTLRVGRSERAGIAVAHDDAMSNAHLELSWDGARCRVRDLGSSSGTLLGGRRVTEADVPHGGWIRAGETDLLVYVEERTPPRDDPGDPRDAAAARLRAARREAADVALAELRKEAGRGKLYAVMNAARDGRILELLREHVEEHRSLFEGTEGEALGDVAPYLTGPLVPGSLLLERLVMEGWGRRWGIYATSWERPRALIRHLRGVLHVKLEEQRGREIWFRFFDPESFAVVLPALTPRQVSEIFGATWRALGEDGSHALVRWGA